MPLYYFHVRKHGELEEDYTGTELPSDKVAYEEALVGAREVLAEHIRRGDPVGADIFEVTKEDGTIIHSISLKSILRFE